jgi:hypothetical protein
MAMAGIALSGTEARRIARGVQMGALGLGVTAAALWALDVPGLGHTPAAAPEAVIAPVVNPGGAAPAAGSGSAPSVFGMDSPLAVATRLEAARKKSPPPPEPVGQPEETHHKVEPETVLKDDWKFLGTIRRREGMSAVVSVAGQQAVIGPGQRLDGHAAEVVEVTHDAIVLREDGTERRILRAERSGSSVAWAKLAGGPPQVAANAVGAVPGAAFSPEQAAAMRQRGIDPAQAQRMREFMRDQRRQRGGRDGGGRGSDGEQRQDMQQRGDR